MTKPEKNMSKCGLLFFEAGFVLFQLFNIEIIHRGRDSMLLSQSADRLSKQPYLRGSSCPGILAHRRFAVRIGPFNA